MIELYHNDVSVCAAKVRTVLAEKKLEWSGHELNLRAGDAQRPDYLRLNPNGVVPTLIHDGRVIIESTVICEYLDDAYPEPALKPRDSYSRARMRLWTKQLDEGLHAATGTLSTCIAFRHQHLKKSPEEITRYLDSLPQPERRERLQKAIELGMDSPTFEPALRRFDAIFDEFDRTLASSQWLAGDSYSLADIAYMPYLIRLEHLGLGILITKRAHVAAWKERVFARPSFKTGVLQWFYPGILSLFESQRASAIEKAAQILG